MLIALLFINVEWAIGGEKDGMVFKVKGVYISAKAKMRERKSQWNRKMRPNNKSSERINKTKGLNCEAFRFVRIIKLINFLFYLVLIQ